MKKTTFVALILLSCQCFADNLKSSLVSVESEWASIYYKMPNQKQKQAYPQLLDKATKLSKQYPTSPELLFWQAVIKATYADHQDAITALQSIHEARDLLIKALKINPNTMNGSAYVTLGTLYYMVPKWPIAFGDNAKAKELLETALKINPNGIDANYYYADYLFANDEINRAEIYYKKAASASTQADQSYSDIRLKEEAKIALIKTQKQKNSRSNDLLSFFSSSSASKPTLSKQ